MIGTEAGRLLFFELDSEELIRKPVWSFEIDRPISSSPAVVDGAVYFGGEDGILYGLGEADKDVETVHIRPIGGPEEIEVTGHAWPTPGGDMGFSCVAPKSSIKPPYDLDWKTRIWSTTKGPMILADGKVFCGGRGGALTALNAAHGEILWRTHHPGVESRPGPTWHDDKVLIMRTRAKQGDSPHIRGASGGPRSGEGLWCHDDETGDVLWQYNIPFAYHFNLDGVCAYKDRVFLCEVDKDKTLKALALDLNSGEVAWRISLPVEIKTRWLPRFSGAVEDGIWYVGVSSGITLAIDALKGEVIWFKDDLGIDGRTRVSARHGKVLVFNKNGAHAYEGRTGRFLWQHAGDRGNSYYYQQALTDLFLDSEGEEGRFRVSGCHWNVYANGYWY
ncbi:MAG: PQQ-binding-like beta-propeller repeat protein, partial [Verrucomicrobiota bacterium]